MLIPSLHSGPVKPGGHVHPMMFVHMRTPRHILLGCIAQTPLQLVPYEFGPHAENLHHNMKKKTYRLDSSRNALVSKTLILLHFRYSKYIFGTYVILSLGWNDFFK